jgi:high-affinity iron transporter
LIALDVLPPLADQLWDTSALLDDSGRFGGFVATMTGYRAQPSLLPLLCLAAFWIGILFFLRSRQASR